MRKFCLFSQHALVFIVLSVLILGVMSGFQVASAETVVTDEQSFINAINSTDTMITVANNITLTKAYQITRDLTIQSPQGATLSWGGAANGIMFTVSSNAHFALENVTLDGNGKYATLVKVNGGIFTMNEGAVLKNVLTNSNNRAVTIGNMTTRSVGGTFNMRGGLITGVKLDGAVACYDGTINMSGNAAISENSAYGIGISRAILNMTGNATISRNAVGGGRPGVGVIASAGSTIHMGLNAGDAPSISGNTSTDSYCGGVYLVDSQLHMDFDAAIADNNAETLGGGVGLSNATLTMKGNAKIALAEAPAQAGAFAHPKRRTP